MRVCLNCGRDLEKSAGFCDICGQPQRSSHPLRITGKSIALLAMAVIMPPVVWLLLMVVLPAK
jgi:predicted amidophosphoribosyltransferase